jgi:hypothetical protein
MAGLDEYGDPIDDTEDTANDFSVPVAPKKLNLPAGLTRESLLTGMMDARTKLADYRSDPSAKWLAIAAALGQPTKTGTIGETASNVAAATAKYKSENRAEEQKRLADRLGIDTKIFDIMSTEETNQSRYAAQLAAARLKAANAGLTPTGQQVVNGRTFVTYMATTGPTAGSVFRVLPEDVAAMGLPPAATPTPKPGALTAVAPTPTPKPGALAAAAAPPKVSSNWQDYIGETVDGSVIGLRPGTTYNVTEKEGPVAMAGTEKPLETRMDPTGRGGEQTLDPVTRDWNYRPGQSPRELEASAKARARQLNVPYMPVAVDPAATREARSAATAAAVTQGRTVQQDIRTEVNAAQKFADDAARFVAVNARTTTGPVVGRIAGVVPPKDYTLMNSITQGMKVLAPKNPGAVSNYEDAGQLKQVPSVNNSYEVNKVIADKGMALAQLGKELSAFTATWASANNGSLDGMEQVWDAYVKANPIFDRSDPDKFANAVPNPKRQTWQRWVRETYYPKDKAAPGAAGRPPGAAERPRAPSPRPAGVGNDWVLMRDKDGNTAWQSPDKSKFVEVR